MVRFVVLRDPLMVDVPLGAGVALLGVSVQAAPAGAPEQVTFTAELNPLSEVLVTMKVADWPAGTGPVGTVAVIEKSGGAELPVPESATCRGEPVGPVKAILRAACSRAAIVGLKVMLMVQLALAASVVVQVPAGA